MIDKRLKSPIIIIGFGRSGTSIVADILLQHSELAYISNYNAKFIRSSSINCLRYIFDNKLWRISGQKRQLNKVSLLNRYTFKSSEAYNFINHVTGRDFGRDFLFNTEESEVAIDRIRNTFSKLVRLQGKKRLGFKITGPSRLGYLSSLFPDAKFILVKREPLPNIRSLLNVDFYQDRKNRLWWHGGGVYSEAEKGFAAENNSRPEIIAALQYYKINEIHAYEEKKYGLEHQVLTLSYEKFVEEPQKAIDKVFEFTGLPRCKHVDHFIKVNRVFDRNKRKEFYFSEKVDQEVKDVALNGCKAQKT